MNAAVRMTDAVQSLEDARRELERRSDEQILDSLCAVLEDWRRAGSRCRREIEARLPEATGFSPETVRAGLERGFAPWTGDAFAALVRRELEGSSGARGHARTAVVLAGSIPMPSVLSILLPLVLRSPVLCKPASRDLLTANLVVDSIREIDPRLAACVAVVPFDKTDADAARTFFSSPCVVTTGSNETVAEVERELTADQARVLYGHRVSLAAVDLDTLSTSAVCDTADQLAIDIALWDQLGCLSPVVFYLVGGDRAAADDFADALAHALAEVESRWPRGSIDVGAAATITSERTDAQMRAALGRDIRVLSSAGTQWTVILEDDAQWRPAPLHRFIRLVRVADEAGLMDHLGPLANVLSGIAIAGFDDRRDALTEALRKAGASRVCRPGTLQAPPIDWPRDNQPLLRGMLASS